MIVFVVVAGHLLDVDDAARHWLVDKGYDKSMGARPMARVIQEQIKKPLAEMVLFGDLAEHGGTLYVTVDADEDSLSLRAEARRSKEKVEPA